MNGDIDDYCDQCGNYIGLDEKKKYKFFENENNNLKCEINRVKILMNKLGSNIKINDGMVIENLKLKVEILELKNKLNQKNKK